MNINDALNKLNALLPLFERQKLLTNEEIGWHKKILHELSSIGKVPDNVPVSILKRLQENDLVVLKNNVVAGAYPFSLRETAHHIFNENIDLYAMCAFDAIAIAPLFSINLNIQSHCYLTNEPIEIYQESEKLVRIKPSDNIHIGIRWQSTGSCSADSLCMEMIFLKDQETAHAWQGSNNDISVFSLDDAIDFSVRFFKPLL